MKTPLQILKDGRQLLIDKGWTQGTYAKDIHGDYIDPAGSDAACFCGHGAIYAAGGYRGVGTPPGNVAQAELALNAAIQDAHFPAFNDAPGRTVEEVLAKFDEAIAAVEAAQ